jgi:phosphotransferase system  glucose/maltose/N-acetylglucosamine-specific IIC component
VRGLSLDFVFLNWMGFALYSLFNVGLFAIPEIKVINYDKGTLINCLPILCQEVFFSWLMFIVFCILLGAVSEAKSYRPDTSSTKRSSIFSTCFVCMLNYLLTVYILRCK